MKGKIWLRKVFRATILFIKMRSCPTWLKRTIKSLITGFLVFNFLSYWPGNCSMPVALLFTALAIFIVGADHIVESENYNRTFRFCGACLKVSAFILLISIVGYLLKFTGLFIADASQIVLLKFSTYGEIITLLALLKFSGFGEILELFALPMLITSFILFMLITVGLFGATLLVSEMAYEEEEYKY